jgi:uncharacterized membrane protein YuzA (DUF378 family)
MTNEDIIGILIGIAGFLSLMLLPRARLKRKDEDSNKMPMSDNKKVL